MHRKILLALIISSSVLLTSCSTGGISKSSQSAFVQGDGVAIYVKSADRKPSPVISGATLSNGNISLAHNKVTVLNIWASWCAPCRAEAPLLSDFSQKYSDQGVQFAGILTRDNTSSALAFTQRFKILYPIFTDDSILASFRNSLVPNAIPTTLIIDSHGYVAARVSGEVTTALLTELLTRVLKDAPHA
jgi:thiol-disulfide isomerase/thioredoxin